MLTLVNCESKCAFICARVAATYGGSCEDTLEGLGEAATRKKRCVPGSAIPSTGDLLPASHLRRIARIQALPRLLLNVADLSVCKDDFHVGVKIHLLGA